MRSTVGRGSKRRGSRARSRTLRAMPRARPELLAAARSYERSGENRLTELFATVLSSHAGLAAALLSDVGLTAGERFDVRTQERVGEGCIPDLVVRSLAANGSLVAELWSEHKTVSGFRPGQCEDYVRLLGERGVAGRLLTITRDHASPTTEWEQRTWQEIGELADGVGRAWGGARWRQEAAGPQAPARERLLHEFLWYLEQEGFAVVRPVTIDDLRVLQATADAAQGMAALIATTAERLGVTDLRSIGWEKAFEAWWLHVPAPPDGWIERAAGHERFCEVAISLSETWWPRSREPVVAAGYTLDRRLHGVLSAKTGWVERIEAAGYVLELAGDWTRCWTTLPLAEVLARGDTLDAQARVLAAWAQASIDGLSRLDPGAL